METNKPCRRCYEGRHNKEICITCPVPTSHPIDTRLLSEESRRALNRSLVGNSSQVEGFTFQENKASGWKLGMPKPSGLLVDNEEKITMTILGYKLKLSPRELKLATNSG